MFSMSIDVWSHFNLISRTVTNLNYLLVLYELQCISWNRLRLLCRLNHGVKFVNVVYPKGCTSFVRCTEKFLLLAALVLI